MPPAVAAATRVSLQLVIKEQWRREHLALLIDQFRKGCQQLGLELMDSPTPIQPILIGDSEKALQVSAALKAKGIWLTAIRPPTVPQGGARLRVTLTAAHTEAQVTQLLEALSEVAV